MAINTVSWHKKRCKYKKHCMCMEHTDTHTHTRNKKPSHLKGRCVAQWLSCGLGGLHHLSECLCSSSGSGSWLQIHANAHPGRQKVLAQGIKSCHSRGKHELSSWLLTSALAQPQPLGAFSEWTSEWEIYWSLSIYLSDKYNSKKGEKNSQAKPLNLDTKSPILSRTSKG